MRHPHRRLVEGREADRPGPPGRGKLDAGAEVPQRELAPGSGRDSDLDRVRIEMAEVDQHRARLAPEFLDRAAARDVELDPSGLGTSCQHAAITNHDKVGGGADLGVCQRFGRQLRPDACGIADRQGKNRLAAVG